MSDNTLKNSHTTVVLVVPAASSRLNAVHSRSDWSSAQSNAAREAMFICTLERVAEAFASDPDFDLVLYLDLELLAEWTNAKRRSNACHPSNSNPDNSQRYTISSDDSESFDSPLSALPDEARAFEVFPQAPGTIGESLAMAWQIIGCGRVIFLGIESPDVPVEMLRSIASQLESVDIALGSAARADHPASDCWAIAGNRHRPGLLENIDYRAGNVYHQLLAAAEREKLTLGVLPSWPVSAPSEPESLLERLEQASSPALTKLRDRLTALRAIPVDDDE